MNNCQRPEIEAMLVVSVAVDREGVPYYTNSTLSTSDVEFYHCVHCGEQFGNWDEANEHYLKGDEA